MKAFALGTMLVLCGALAACSSSSSDGSGGSTSTGDGGGDEGGGSGDGGSTSTPTATSATTTTTTTGSPTTTTTTGGGCSVGEFFAEPVCDGCLNAQCCSQAEACIADFQAGGTDCVDAEGAFTDGPIAEALFACLDSNCAEECGGGAGICETGLASENPEADACIDASCCPEFITCYGADGSNLEACNACLEAGGGPECDDYLACTETAGCFSDICDTGLSFGSAEADACFETGDCCADLDTCLAAGDAECVDCINAFLEGGAAEPTCADFVACGEAGGCFAAE